MLRGFFQAMAVFQNKTDSATDGVVLIVACAFTFARKGVPIDRPGSLAAPRSPLSLREPHHRRAPGSAIRLRRHASFCQSLAQRGNSQAVKSPRLRWSLGIHPQEETHSQ